MLPRQVTLLDIPDVENAQHDADSIALGQHLLAALPGHWLVWSGPAPGEGLSPPA